MQSKIKTVTVIAAMLLMTFSFTSFSQTSKFGISINSLTTNFNYGKLNSELHDYKKNYTGLQAGISYQAGISPMFSVVPELYFAMKGGSLTAGNTLTTNKSTLRIYSLELPVMARLHFKDLYINAGPYAGYNLGGRLKIDKTDDLPGSTTKISFDKSGDGFKRLDYGLLVGAGYNFDLKKSILTLDVRYGYGLANISNDIERYNRTLNISLQLSKPNRKAAK